MSVLPWRWRTRSGRARANILLREWRNIVLNFLKRDLINTNGDAIVCFCRFKAVLASYRLTKKDNPSIRLLTELNILGSPGVSQLEKDDAKDRISEIMLDEANSFFITDPASSHNDSSMDEDNQRIAIRNLQFSRLMQIAREPWRWRTRSGTTRAARLMQRWRNGGNAVLKDRLDSADGSDAAIPRLFYVFKRLLASYRLTNKDNPSIKLLAELDIMFDNPGVSELEKKDATDRLWEFLHYEADSIIFNDNSEDEDSDNSTDEGGSEGYSSMDEEE